MDLCGFNQMALHFVLGQILHTDVVYLHSGQGFREAEKIKKLLLQYKYATESSIYSSFLPNKIKILTVEIFDFECHKNSTDLTGGLFSLVQSLLFLLCTCFCSTYTLEAHEIKPLL